MYHNLKNTSWFIQLMIFFFIPPSRISTWCQCAIIIMKLSSFTVCANPVVEIQGQQFQGSLHSGAACQGLGIFLAAPRLPPPLLALLLSPLPSAGYGWSGSGHVIVKDTKQPHTALHSSVLSGPHFTLVAGHFHPSQTANSQHHTSAHTRRPTSLSRVLQFRTTA